MKTKAVDEIFSQLIDVTRGVRFRSVLLILIDECYLVRFRAKETY